MHINKLSVSPKTALLLAVLLAGQTLISGCGSAESIQETAAATDAQTIETETAPEWALPERDFAGEAVTFILRYTGGDWSADDVMTDELDGTPVNDAVYNRNSVIEEKYNVKIEGFNAPTDQSIYGAVINSVTANDDAFDVTVSWQHDAVKFMMENIYMDLSSMDYLQLNQSWWAPSYSAVTSMMGKQFYALGDISRVYKLGVRCLFFNKNLAEDLQLDSVYGMSLYDLVLEDKWDYEAFFSLAELGHMDLDGNGTMDENDRYGIQGQSALSSALAIGGDLRITDKDDKDKPILTANTERNMEILDRLSSYMITHQNNIFTSDDWAYTQKRFSENLVLFQAEVLLMIEALRASEVDIGILPSPKWDLSQENYISFLDGWCQNVYGIPVTCGNTDMVSFVLEAMAQGSVDTLNVAFYDVCLNGKYVRDQESSAMLDIIFANCRTENAEVFGWGTIYDNIKWAIPKGTVASAVSSFANAAKTEMDTTIADFCEMHGIQEN